MPKKSFSLKERIYSGIVALLLLIAAVLVVILIVQSKMGTSEDVTLNHPSVVDTDVTPEPLRLRTTSTPGPSLSPTPTAAPSPTPYVVEYDYLPVYSRVETDQKMIAVTMDDCSHLSNMRKLVDFCRTLNVRLTLFPIGKGIMLDGMYEVYDTLIEDLGFQVENHTFSDAKLYSLSDSEMCSEIWSTDIALDYILGKDYQMHFLRMRGGSGTKDTRLHHYLKQIGYDGIVTWTVSGTAASQETLQKSLAPGNIYQFNSTTADCTKMAEFMQYAISEGYALVTVNELLGLPANESVRMSQSDILSQKLPELEGYVPVFVEHKVGDYAWQVYLIQSRLAELGYLNADDVDGAYGRGTSSAISAFQATFGQLATGIATSEVQLKLFSSDAPPNPYPVTPAPAEETEG